eukprot:RCo043552
MGNHRGTDRASPGSLTPPRHRVCATVSLANTWEKVGGVSILWCPVKRWQRRERGGGSSGFAEQRDLSDFSDFDTLLSTFPPLLLLCRVTALCLLEFLSRTASLCKAVAATAPQPCQRFPVIVFVCFWNGSLVTLKCLCVALFVAHWGPIWCSGLIGLSAFLKKK